MGSTLNDVFLYSEVLLVPLDLDQDQITGIVSSLPRSLYPNKAPAQVQHQNALYKGTFDAYRQISRSEGYRGLYRGFWISAFQVFHVPANLPLVKLILAGGVWGGLRVYL